MVDNLDYGRKKWRIFSYLNHLKMLNFLVKTFLIIDYHTFLLSYNHTLNKKMGISVAMAVFDHLHFVVPIEKTCFTEIKISKY